MAHLYRVTRIEGETVSIGNYSVSVGAPIDVTYDIAQQFAPLGNVDVQALPDPPSMSDSGIATPAGGAFGSQPAEKPSDSSTQIVEEKPPRVAAETPTPKRSK